ncbi:unnamed protein product, partial [marine sediment metagenome]
ADVLRLDVNCITAEVRHRNLEAYSGPQAWLFEKHCESLAAKARIATADAVQALQFAAFAEQLFKLLG